jgi:hypothetical protein
MVTLGIREICDPEQFFISVYSIKANVVCATGEEAISAARGMLKTPESFYVHSVEVLETFK